jgi:hypothetical protein
MEKMNNNIPWTPNPYGGYYPPYPYGRVVQPPPAREKAIFPTGKNELLFGSFVVVFGLILCNFTLFGGFNVGFAIAAILCICGSAGYLIASGCRLTTYSTTLLTLSVIITAGFGRTDDGFVKFVMFFFLLISCNLGLCLLAGQNRSCPSGITSMIDVPLTLFLGFGQMAPAFRGMGRRIRSGGPAIKKGGAVLLGLAVTIPLLCILIPLLMSADAAFEGLIHLLPDFNINEAFITVIFGGGIYASGISGISFIKKNMHHLQGKKVIIYCDGASPFEEKAFQQIIEHNLKGSLAGLPCFYCRGSWDPDAMSFVDRNLCRMLRKAVSKKKPEDYEVWEKALMEAGDKK